MVDDQFIPYITDFTRVTCKTCSDHIVIKKNVNIVLKSDIQQTCINDNFSIFVSMFNN